MDGITDSMDMSLSKLWELVMSSNNLILRHPLLLLPSIFPSIRVFQMSQFFASGGQKYWTFRFSFNFSPSSDYSGLISFRMDWLDLCNIRDSQESSLIPQFKSIKSSLLTLLYGSTLTSIHDYWKNHSF